MTVLPPTTCFRVLRLLIDPGLCRPHVLGLEHQVVLLFMLMHASWSYV